MLTMKTDLVEIFQTIRADLQPYTASGFTATVNSENHYELWADQGIDTDGGKKDIVCFASLKIMDGYVELVIQPFVEDSELSKVINPDLLAIAQDNHFKVSELDDKMAANISSAIGVAITHYKQKGWG